MIYRFVWDSRLGRLEQLVKLNSNNSKFFKFKPVVHTNTHTFTLAYRYYHRSLIILRLCLTDYLWLGQAPNLRFGSNKVMTRFTSWLIVTTLHRSSLAIGATRAH